MPATESSPRFCPECRRPGRADASLCAHCGTTLVGQGYCPTCERRWLLRPGEHCPKHDQPLSDGPPVPDDPDAFAPDWATVATFPHPLAAEGARLRLEAEGIPTFVDGTQRTEHLPYAAGLGGVRLQVPRNLLPDARVLLRQSWSKADEPLDDLADPLDLPPPRPAPPSFFSEPMFLLALVCLIVVVLYFLARR